MTLPSRAAAIRGDDYQHAVGWVAACTALTDPDVESVSVEDAGGGHFDDIVTRRRSGPDEYIQVKSSNHGNVIIDESWLLKPVTPTGRSPLQHFHATWRTLSTRQRPFKLILLTNRGFAHDDPILGRLRDLKTDQINIGELRTAVPGSKPGQERQRWAAHLGIGGDELLDFLAAVTWKHSDSEPGWDERARPLMRLAGLRSDDQAVTIGKAIVRSWVTGGMGPQQRDDIRRQVADKDLLARAGTLTLAVHAIDRQPTATAPNVELDFAELFDGDDPFTRRQLKDPAHWQAIIKPALARAARALEAYGPRRVHVTGSMRLPMWFAVGRELPDVRQWVLSLDQRGQEWLTSPADSVTPRVLADVTVGNGADLALAIGLTHNPAADVERYIRATRLPVATLLVLGPDGEPGPASVPNAAWAAGWARAARENARMATAETNAHRVHLFIAAPAAIALMLGHQWNLMPATTLYEHVPPRYVPTLDYC